MRMYDLALPTSGSRHATRTQKNKLMVCAGPEALLKKLAGRHHISRIATRLKRTVFAVRNKARTTGVSLAYTYRRAR